MYLFTQSVTKESINSTHISRLIAAVIGFERLEPYDGKLSRTVLRGGAGSNVLPLPDYASVEIQRNPDLLGKLVAVCGSQENRQGIVLAASYPAKRRGVKTGQAIWQVKQAESITVPITDISRLKGSPKMNYELFYDMVLFEIELLKAEETIGDYKKCIALAACYELQEYLAGKAAAESQVDWLNTDENDC